MPLSQRGINQLDTLILAGGETVQKKQKKSLTPPCLL
jgi:hypothetical protein